MAADSRKQPDRAEARRETVRLAIGIALLPPLWAVLAPHLHIETGAVALICAGIYVASGNQVRDAVRISLGFLCGDLWALAVIGLSGLLPWNPELELFLLLALLGGAAVLIAGALPRLLYLPAWLCGWAVGLTVMGSLTWQELGTLPLQIAAAMLVGVWYVGAGVSAFTKLLKSADKRKEEKR